MNKFTHGDNKESVLKLQTTHVNKIFYFQR